MFLRMACRVLQICFLSGLTCASSAQTSSSGAVTGVITDQSNAVVPNAEVEIRDSTTGTVRTTKTDREGVYQFSLMAPGTYALRVRHSKFREEQRAVNVLLGPTVSLNVTLAIAGTRSEVMAVTDVPFLEAENGDASATMNRRQISEVPNPGNDLTYIVQTTPAVVMNTDVPNSPGMNFSILGMPSTSYRYSIDGVDNPPIGALGLMLGQNQMQEATVLSTGYSGQFGNAAGGNINYLTKSGSNQFHGNAQYYWNGSVLNANDWFNKAFGNPRPFDIANQWAGSFGGPLKKNKLFFFSDTEGLRILVPQFTQLVIPSPEFVRATITNIDRRFGAGSPSHTFYQKLFNLYNAAPGASSASPGSFTQGDLGCAGRLVSILPEGGPCVLHTLVARGTPGQDALTAVRVDWNLSGSDRLFLHVEQGSGEQTIFANAVSSLFDQIAKTGWWELQAVETHIFSPSAASQLVLAYSKLRNFSGVDDLSKTLDAFPTQVFFPPPEQFFDLGGSSFQLRDAVAQFQISDDLMESGRRHKLGAGFNFVRVHSGKSFSPDVGLLIPNTLDAFYQGGADPDFANTDFTTAAKSFRSILSEPTVSYRLGIYGQDEWHPRPDLSATIALRAEYGSSLACETRCFARLAGPFNAVTHDPSQPYNQVILTSQKQAFQMFDALLWSPRFSFAWQPFGVKRNIVMRGGIGFFYDSVESIAANFAGNPPQVNSFTVNGDVLAPDEMGGLLSRTTASNAAFIDAFEAGHTLPQIQASIPDFSPPGMTTSGRRTRAPQYQRWSLQVQQTFGSETSLTVGYFGHHGIHELVQNPNANAWGFGSLPTGRCNDAVADCAPDPRFSGVTEWDTRAISNYHGMVTSFQHRFDGWGPGLFQANYTYSHTLDEVSNGGVTPFSNWSRLPFSVTPQDPNNLRGAYGSADYDVRHSLNANYVLELPIKTISRGHGPSSLVKGWQISGTVFARTGMPYTVLDIFPPPDLVRKNYFSLLYAVPVRPLDSGSSCGKAAAAPLAPDPCVPVETLPDQVTPGPNALFVQPGCETGFDIGRLGPTGVCDGPTVSFRQGRNRFRGPHYFNTDFTIIKRTPITRREGATFGVGFQFFNFLNHPNFGFPMTALGPPTGMIFYQEQPPTSILGNGNGGFGADVAPRMIQLKAELKF